MLVLKAYRKSYQNVFSSIATFVFISTCVNVGRKVVWMWLKIYKSCVFELFYRSEYETAFYVILEHVVCSIHWFHLILETLEILEINFLSVCLSVCRLSSGPVELQSLDGKSLIENFVLIFLSRINLEPNLFLSPFFILSTIILNFDSSLMVYR